MSQSVYLDWAATTPLCEEAAKAMAPYLIPGIDNLAFGANANSLHSLGRNAFSALEDARTQVARMLGAGRPDEIIFTSGATEANNAAIFGIVSACVKRAKQQGKRDFVPHIIVSAIEHDAVLAPAKRLKSEGCELTVLQTDRQGMMSVETLQEALRENTVLVSIQMANNEIGTIQDIVALAAEAHKAGAFFHTDAVQALGKVPLNLKELGVDAASFSAHKICGPKGVGVLYLKTATPFDAFIVGGGQEQGKRSGTQNVCGAVGFTAACKAISEQQEAERLRLAGMRDYLYEKLSVFDKVHPSVAVEKGSTCFLPNIVNICVEEFESETLILRLDRAGFEVSGGSACSSHSLEQSHVLKALAIPEKLALGSLRISFGRFTTKDDIDAFLKAFQICVSGEDKK